MSPEEDRNARGCCARTACQVDLGNGGGHVHQHLRYRYCDACARAINAACPEAPPFDLKRRTLDQALEDAFGVCPECSAPWRLHWQHSGPPSDRRSRYNTCGLSRAQIAAKWLPVKEASS